jgi:small-conductance mechanosensitive channel
MTVSADVVPEGIGETAEVQKPSQSEQPSFIQESPQEDKALPLQGAISNEIGNYWDSAYFIIRYFLAKAAHSLNLDKGQLKGINSITKLILIVVAITIIIFHFSSLSGIAASAISVAAGTIIGFSSRNTISNAIAGILLLSARPFKIGDRIKTTESDYLIGDVIEISLLYTKLKSIRNELVTIPNQTLLQNQIVNYSGFDILATSVEVSIIYQNNRKLVESLLVDSAKKTEGIIQDSPSPFVLLKRFDNYAAVYELRAYTNRANEYLKIQSEIRKNIYDLLQKNGLDLTVLQAQTNMDKKDIDFTEHLR